MSWKFYIIQFFQYCISNYLTTSLNYIISMYLINLCFLSLVTYWFDLIWYELKCVTVCIRLFELVYLHNHFVILFEKANGNILWHVCKLFSSYFKKSLLNSLWKQFIAYIKIVWFYLIFCYENSLYIKIYMINTYIINA
jgi:hypothetical protein